MGLIEGPNGEGHRLEAQSPGQDYLMVSEDLGL